MDLNVLLSRVIEIGGSDLHLKVASPSMARDPLKTEKIAAAIAEGQVHHMQSFSESLVELVLAGLADRETAANAATNRHDFELAVDDALREASAAERGELRTVDTSGDGDKPTRLRLAST
jgi:Tfp pilus assembly pilus retraction ATPase PilT